MQRILIIGCGGAGKSTLAKRMGDITGLPVVHLDQVYWSPGNWNHVTREEFDEKLEQLLVKDQWIMDGDFSRTFPKRLEHCDTVIYLDFNRITCLLHWLKRVITNWGKARPDMAEGCTEWFDPEFAKWIWNYNKVKRPANYELLANSSGVQCIILKNGRKVRKFLRTLEAEKEISV